MNPAPKIGGWEIDLLAPRSSSQRENRLNLELPATYSRQSRVRDLSHSAAVDPTRLYALFVAMIVIAGTAWIRQKWLSIATTQ